MSKSVVAVGEVLWDVIGGRRHLGGAPFNFAVHSRNLGAATSAIISRVGKDALGDEILERAGALGVDITLIQRDDAHPTGQVLVTVGPDGQPTFDICADAAYDHLAVEPKAVERLSATDAVYFGTLAQRHPVARAAIAALLDAAQGALVVCDLNLRPPYYSAETVRDSLARCRALKLNEEELRIVRGLLGQEGKDEEAFLSYLLEAYHFEWICVTLGAQGCILRTPQERVASPGYVCQAVDAVGAGDAFTAALVLRYLEGCPLAEVADFANLVGAYITTQPGATPPLSLEGLAAFRSVAPRSPSPQFPNQLRG